MKSLGRSLLGSLGLALALAGCTPNGSSPTSVEGALASGRVDSDGGASSGVTVRAYGMAPDGTLSVASDTTTTSADGRYTLTVSLTGAATALVVRVEDGTSRTSALGRAAVDADVGSSGTITLAPIDASSTFATDVMTSLEASENVSLEESASMALFLSPDARARLGASADHEAAVADAADAVSSARATFVDGLAASASGSGAMQLALRGIAEEEAHLAARLDTATADADVRAAYSAYLDAVLDGASSAGFSGEAIAAASLSASSALDANVGGRVSGSHAELHQLSTFAVTSAVDAGIAGSLDSRDIRTASAALRASAQTMASTGASADASATAWASYVSTIRSEAIAHASLTETLFARLTADIVASTDTLMSTWAQVGASASASERVQAFLDFRASVESSAHMTLLSNAGFTDGSAHALLDAMTDVSASTALH